jgi:HAMP domain-containing protein
VLRESERWAISPGAAQLVALVLLVGFMVDRVVVRRLDVLTRAMRDVEQGDMERRVPVGNPDEVGRLSHGFNRMLDQLSAADREIRAFNQRLADEIDAATQDLHKKNVALGQLNRLLIDLRRENASRVRLATLGSWPRSWPTRSAPRCPRCPGTCSWRCASGTCCRAARAAGGGGARDRAHRPDRA